EKSKENKLPNKYELLGNYPNPFNPATTISYALPYESKVEIVIYDLLGKKIKHFLWDSQTSGYHVAIWDGKNEDGSQVSSGIYIYRIKAISIESKSETFEASSKLILMK
ncbi:MAG: T9SS type A sorting domain-containing protein, partial [Bacteroidetes bacterium]|nr:T9SS type A sorting domain-containing protein [Bacteroidota bacterium]